MPAKRFFVQVGATRDGLDPYADAARHRGLTAVLVETPDYLRWRELLGRRPYDVTLPVEHPASPEELIAAMRTLPQAPELVLAGFERYVSASYAAAQAFQAIPAGQSPAFRAPYKRAQRTAISQVTALRQPRYTLVDSLADLGIAAEGMTYPIVVKPDDGGGGLGVVLVPEPASLRYVSELLDGVRNYDGGAFTGWVVEEYLPGTELSVQAVARDGIPHILTYCEKLTTIESEHEGLLRSFRESGHVAHPGAEADEQLVDFVQRCIGAVGYRQGPFHVDMIRDGASISLLEMGFRLSGMRVVELVHRVCGVSWAEAAFDAHLGTSSSVPQQRRGHRYAGHLTLRRPDQLAAAEAIEASDSVDVEIQRYPVPPMPREWAQEIPGTLRSDVVRHAGAVGRVVISASDARTVATLLSACRAPKRARLTTGDRT